MKICLMGHFKGSLDEGVRNTGKNIAKELQRKGIQVKVIDISAISYWKSIRDFGPDIIHFVLTPTLSGIIYTKFLSILFFKAKTIISAVHPSLPNWKLLALFKPNLVLVQSYDSEKLFTSIGFQTRFLPNGVDINRFEPVDIQTKRELRRQFGVPIDQFVILHLASFKKERNLDIFKRIQNLEQSQVVIIGREDESVNKDVVYGLREAGCLVWIKHFANIEQIYNLSDCYVFPTSNKKACIETPLSVLEAMACNLPVITTKFGALPRIFDEGHGIFFIEREEDILTTIRRIKNEDLIIKTRQKALFYSWGDVANTLVEIYGELLR